MLHGRKYAVPYSQTKDYISYIMPDLKEDRPLLFEASMIQSIPTQVMITRGGVMDALTYPYAIC